MNKTVLQEANTVLDQKYSDKHISASSRLAPFSID